MATLQGKPIDRPAVNFYEIGGFVVNMEDPDPFNIYNSPSWRPLIQLAEEKTDLIRLARQHTLPGSTNPGARLYTVESWEENGSRFTRRSLDAGGRTFTETSRRDPDADTVWILEHLLKDADDLRAYLALPDEAFEHPEVDIAALERQDAELGERGILMVDSPDPLCIAAGLFDMATYCLIATTEPELFRQLLDRIAAPLYARAERIAREFPGRLWRIVGAEYATEPYLSPDLFKEYVVGYTGPIVDSVKRYGGYPRIHCHGRVQSALPMIAAMGAEAIDPLEPPPQGDVYLADVRREYGQQMVLFGNIEVSELVGLRTAVFRERAEQAVRDGTAGEGRGFVLMPTSGPYGRDVTPQTLTNYETLIDVVEKA
jgi:uroporphyrinogen-III decarboxylase